MSDEELTIELFTWFADKSLSRADSILIMAMAIATTIVNCSTNDFEQAELVGEFGGMLTRFIELARKAKEKLATQ